MESAAPTALGAPDGACPAAPGALRSLFAHWAVGFAHWAVGFAHWAVGFAHWAVPQTRANRTRMWSPRVRR
jgi:hypothetical protein